MATNALLCSKVSFEEKSSSSDAAAVSLTLRVIRKFWHELMLILGLCGIRELMVLALGVITAYLQIMSHIWALQLSLIVSSLLVIFIDSNP